MSPILRTGDMVYIGPVKAEALTVGNIALFKRGREMVAHRLIDKTMSSGQVFLWTKGDTFSSGDFPIKEGDVIGLVYAVEKFGMVFDLKKGIFSKLNKLAYLLSPLTSFLYDTVRCYRGFETTAGMDTRSKEDMLLISLLQNGFSDTTPGYDTAMALKDSVDLPKVLQIARDNKVSQQIYARLKKYPFIAPLRKDYLATAAKNTMLFSEFRRVVGGLRENR